MFLRAKAVCSWLAKLSLAKVWVSADVFGRELLAPFSTVHRERSFISPC